ncbi:hypothetical protein VN12_19685 [Pirellula sp. SH-Sr6A]|nr:hypothetical protein VN12_19685 [Pirellula sp. SH-Sr6A]
MSELNDTSKYQVTLTGREIYWLTRLANEELVRMQNLSVEDGNPMLDAKRHRRWGPISDVFIKLSQISEVDEVKGE